MAAEPDFEDSLIVEIITYMIYFGWHAILAAIALYIGIPPLPEIQAAIEPNWQGTAAAIAAGIAFLTASRFVYDALRKRMASSQKAPDPDPAPAPAPEPSHGEPKKRRKKRRKKR